MPGTKINSPSLLKSDAILPIDPSGNDKGASSVSSVFGSSLVMEEFPCPSNLQSFVTMVPSERTNNPLWALSIGSFVSFTTPQFLSKECM